MKRAMVRFMAALCIDTAREHLDRYGLATDDPDPAMVEAADLLDAAAQCLESADFASAIKGARAGEA